MYFVYLIQAARHSLAGWKELLKTEKNTRYLLLLLFFHFGLGFTSWVTLSQMGILILSTVIITGMEITNTAIEKTLDLLIPFYHIRVGTIKDIMSATVFLGICVHIALLILFLIF